MQQYAIHANLRIRVWCIDVSTGFGYQFQANRMHRMSEFQSNDKILLSLAVACFAESYIM
jgi:hypothetical protein